MSHGLRKLGLFGGTFNPIHHGHLKVALVVHDYFRLDKILFIPSYLPPHKPRGDIALPEDRLKMVELAISPYPQFEASSIEIERPETSYSIVTLEKIKRLYPEAQIYFIVGIDAFLEIKTWREYEKLLTACSFIVVSRPGFNLDQALEVLGDAWKDKMIMVKSREQIKEKEPQIYLFPMASLNISASEIRKRRQRGEAITGLVPEKVEKYILENKLYCE